MTSVISHKKLLKYKKYFRTSNFQVIHDPEGGTIKVIDSDRVVCFQAVQKKRRGSWIATFHNSVSVNWR